MSFNKKFQDQMDPSRVVVPVRLVKGDQFVECKVYWKVGKHGNRLQFGGKTILSRYLFEGEGDKRELSEYGFLLMTGKNRPIPQRQDGQRRPHGMKRSEFAERQGRYAEA